MDFLVSRKFLFAFFKQIRRVVVKKSILCNIIAGAAKRFFYKATILATNFETSALWDQILVHMPQKLELLLQHGNLYTS